VSKPRSQSEDWAADAPSVRGGAARAAAHRSELPAALEVALTTAIAKGARAPTILRVAEVAGYTDWVMIVSGRSERQVGAIADGISRALREMGLHPRGTDGMAEHLWDLLDYDEFMVHVFFHPIRNHYDLESMWSDAPRVELGLPAEVMDTADLDAIALPEQLPAYRGDAAFGGFEDEFVADDDEPADDGTWDDDDWPADGEDDVVSAPAPHDGAPASRRRE
jgi:ribosome-associated protein